MLGGSYTVSMAQPRRGLANTFLELGYDITERTPQMYDISGWSLSELWGATVVRTEDGLPRRVTPVSDAAADRASLPRGQVAAYAFQLDGIESIQVVNDLWADGVDVWRAADGAVLVDGAARSSLGRLAANGVVVEGLQALPADAEPLDAFTVGTSVASDETFVLERLGYDLVPVSEDGVSDGTVDLGTIDVLAVSGGFDVDDLSADGRAAFDAWLADGGGVVGIGSGGAAFNVDADLLDVGWADGPSCSTANGVVQVDVDPAAPSTAGFPQSDTSFVYDPIWFTDTDGVTVDQRYDAVDVLIAGHWLGDDEAGANGCGRAQPDTGQDDAAGQAAVVSGTDEVGARVVLFGTEPMFRDHPRKLYRQVANALLWTSAG